ncbi:MAG: carboxypeptidase regulatory-like domain-containing protein, partial [Terriglobia bacterium]
GTLFEFLQNTDLNANRWENNLAGSPRNPLKQNQFGGSVGFPIIKNKLFMFGDYQGTRLRTAGGTVSNLGYGGFYTLPTLAMRNGDFSRMLGSSIGTINGINVVQNEMFDPTTTACISGCAAGSLSALSGATPVYTRTPYANNKIPQSEWDPAAAKILSQMPTPNQPIKVGNYPQNDFYTVTPGNLTTDQGDGRVDYHMNDSNSIFGSISWVNTEKSSIQPYPGPMDAATFYGVSETDLGRDAQIGWTHIISPTVVNDLHAGYSRQVTSRLQANYGTDEYKAVGIGGYDPTGAAQNNGGLPYINWGRYNQNQNNWLPTQEYSNEWDFIENLSIVEGSHSIKVGAEFRELHFPFFQVPYPHGELDYSQAETAYPSSGKDSGGQSGTYSADTGDQVASFLLGAINSGQISTTNFVSSTKQAYAGYVEDTWKTTDKLTLTLGVRYELFSPIGEQFARQSNFVFQNMTLYIPKGPNQDAPLPPNFNTDYTAPNGFTYPADFPNVKVSRGSVSPYLIPWDKTDIGPRLGFAYNIVPKTVIRGFFGMFYGGEENQGGNPNRGESAPFNESPSLGRPAGVGGFQPNPNFANGNAIGGLTVGFPTNIFTTFPVTSL